MSSDESVTRALRDVEELALQAMALEFRSPSQDEGESLKRIAAGTRLIDTLRERRTVVRHLHEGTDHVAAGGA